MHRFFVPSNAVREGEVILTDGLARQIARVLRMSPGDHVIVLDNSGWQWETELVTVRPGEVRGRVLGRRLADGEPKVKITLYQAMLRKGNIEFALQKGTELGIVEFVPMITDRCIVANFEDVNKKLERWRRIVREAAEQSRRGRLPAIEPAMLFRKACERARHVGGLILLPWEGEGRESLREILAAAPLPLSIGLFIGPEGGFTEEEVRLSRGYGIRTISLGPRILRAETAGLVATSAILYESGDLEPRPA